METRSFQRSEKDCIEIEQTQETGLFTRHCPLLLTVGDEARPISLKRAQKALFSMLRHSATGNEVINPVKGQLVDRYRIETLVAELDVRGDDVRPSHVAIFGWGRRKEGRSGFTVPVQNALPNLPACFGEPEEFAILGVH